MEHLVDGLSLISKQQTHIWSQIWEKAYPLEWAPTYSYPLFCPSPTAPRLAKRHAPSIYNAKCCVTNPQQPLFSWLKRSFQLEGFKAFGKLFIIVACDCRYRRETEQVLIRVLIHPYSRGDEVPCTLFTYYRGGREESYNQIKTYWDFTSQDTWFHVGDFATTSIPTLSSKVLVDQFTSSNWGERRISLLGVYM